MWAIGALAFPFLIIFFIALGLFGWETIRLYQNKCFSFSLPSEARYERQYVFSSSVDVFPFIREPQTVVYQLDEFAFAKWAEENKLYSVNALSWSFEEITKQQYFNDLHPKEYQIYLSQKECAVEFVYCAGEKKLFINAYNYVYPEYLDPTSRGL